MIRLYIDPGTGSMLFTILIAVIGSVIYLFRAMKIRIGTVMGRKKETAAEQNAQPLVIFSDHKRYWNVFEPICNELERRGQETLYLTESEDDPIFGKQYQHIRAEWIGEGNKAYAKLNFLKASVLLSTTPGLETYQWKRSRDVSWYVHIPHAASDITMYRMFGLDFYDAVLLSGAYQVNQIRQLEEVHHRPEKKEVEIVGIPFMDAMKARLASAPPLPEKREGERTVLLAPSWGPSGIFSVCGEELLNALVTSGYHIIVRPHPQSLISEKELIEGLMIKYPESEHLEWNRDNDNFEVLRRADILISDFSGVLFDYTLVFDKPVIYTDTYNFDKGVYDCYWLDEKLWTFETLPKLGVQLSKADISRVKELIDQCTMETRFKEARDQARTETWQHPGEGAMRTVDYLLKKVHEYQTVK